MVILVLDTLFGGGGGGGGGGGRTQTSSFKSNNEISQAHIYHYTLYFDKLFII